jgi:hypothetical protein
VIAAVAMCSSAAGSSSARLVPGFRSPTGNIQCYYDPKAFVPPNGTKRLLTCGLRHADYAMQLQRRCLAGDWHGFTLFAKGKPTIFCAGNPNYAIRPVYTTLAYGKSGQRGPFTCSSRITGVCTSASAFSSHVFGIQALGEGAYARSLLSSEAKPTHGICRPLPRLRPARVRHARASVRRMHPSERRARTTEHPR